jgi:IMP and pyridine-specific 5'-nucleotidase
LLCPQARLAGSALPFCAFNGGNDVFVDVGNKSIGLQALQRHLGARPDQVLHVGDRFTITGNDNQVRGCCSILWVANPDETAFFVQLLLNDIAAARAIGLSSFDALEGLWRDDDSDDDA